MQKATYPVSAIRLHCSDFAHEIGGYLFNRLEWLPLAIKPPGLQAVDGHPVRVIVLNPQTLRRLRLHQEEGWINFA